MSVSIGKETGIVVAHNAWRLTDPAHKVAFDKHQLTDQALVDNSNDYHKRLANVEGRLDALPFPLSSS